MTRPVRIALAVVWVAVIAWLCLLTVKTTDDAVAPVRHAATFIRHHRGPSDCSRPNQPKRNGWEIKPYCPAPLQPIVL